MEETFYRTHKYLVEHLAGGVRRLLMDEIDWSERLIGIKGSRGVGKTTFLLQYAKEHFDTDRSCLYINFNHFYFTKHTLLEFADDFYKHGGKTLLIDQMFKYENWSKELRICYERFPNLKIVFTASPVMRLKDENSDLHDIIKVYNLRGFSFREFLNIQAGVDLQAYTLSEILKNHTAIAEEICAQVKPLAYFQDYLHHGFYPCYLEKYNYSENLLKTMNMMLEVDILLIKQIDIKYLSKVRKLLYLLALKTPCAPNVSQYSKEIETSRATVMNYIKYLKDARFFNLLYPQNEEFPKKPEKVYMHNTNLMYAVSPNVESEDLRKTFFYHALHTRHKVNAATDNAADFMIDRNSKLQFKVEEKEQEKINPNIFYAEHKTEIGEGRRVPLWLFGFLY
ncbi:MAG: AAA family ATPase [Prevotellaceae bacterium]|nr:AAA family ATPase [Prevotellaceae bacterium]